MADCGRLSPRAGVHARADRSAARGAGAGQAQTSWLSALPARAPGSTGSQWRDRSGFLAPTADATHRIPLQLVAPMIPQSGPARRSCPWHAVPNDALADGALAEPTAAPGYGQPGAPRSASCATSTKRQLNSALVARGLGSQEHELHQCRTCPWPRSAGHRGRYRRRRLGRPERAGS